MKFYIGTYISFKVGQQVDVTYIHQNLREQISYNRLERHGLGIANTWHQLLDEKLYICCSTFDSLVKESYYGGLPSDKIEKVVDSIIKPYHRILAENPL